MKRCTVSIFIIHVLYMNLAKKWCLSPNKHRFIDIRLFLLAWLLLIGWRRNVPYHKQTHILTTRLDEVSLSLSLGSIPINRVLQLEQFPGIFQKLQDFISNHSVGSSKTIVCHTQVWRIFLYIQMIFCSFVCLKFSKNIGCFDLISFSD